MIALQISEIILDENYWDCECESRYIHAKQDNPEAYCILCEAVQADQPDSRVSEIKIENLAFSHLTIQPRRS
jgi:hypothetical protein